MNIRCAALLCVVLPLGLSACMHMDVSQKGGPPLPDGSTIHFTRFGDENPWGMDSTTVVASRCPPNANPGQQCQTLDVAHGFQQGGARAIIQSTGTAAVLATGFVVGNAVRRPDNVNVSGGSSSALSQTQSQSNDGSNYEVDNNAP